VKLNEINMIPLIILNKLKVLSQGKILTILSTSINDRKSGEINERGVGKV
jgi:hypothetical protein